MIGPQNSHALIIDDDPDFLRLAGFLLDKAGHSWTGALSYAEATALVRDEKPGVVFLDWQLDDVDGIGRLSDLKQKLPSTPIVLVTGHGSTETVVRAIKLGAFDYLEKPLEEPRFYATVSKAFEHADAVRRVDELAVKASSTDSFDRLVGSSPAMTSVRDAIRNVAPTNATVWVQGESGTGKELVARAIHEQSERRGGPFVALNMAALPEELIEATLFGHERGAFTGADRRRIGACEEAAGGTLFLDEIAEMPIGVQAKLLRVLQERTFRRIGGSNDLAADCRIVSATNREPQEAVGRGNLREDLFYRLHVFPIVLPPLRERTGDIAILAMWHLKEMSRRYGKEFDAIDADAIRHLEAHRWPGNVRELLHVMERCAILNHGRVLESEMLPSEYRHVESEDAGAKLISGGESPGDVGETTQAILPLPLLERHAIERAVRLCNGEVGSAARSLGVSQATLYRRLRQYRAESLS